MQYSKNNTLLFLSVFILQIYFLVIIIKLVLVVAWFSAIIWVTSLLFMVWEEKNNYEQKI